MTRSKVYRLLRGLSYEVMILLLAKAKTDNAKRPIKDFLLDINRTKIKTTGDDLERMGFEPSPNLGKALKRILYAKIDGKIRTKRDELLYAARYARRLGM